MNEAGASNRQTPAANRRNKARTERKERAGKTAQLMKEGRGADQPNAGRSGSLPKERLCAELYKEAQRRGIQGMSRASKAELEAVLRRR